jgi:hypothetical protein
MKKLYEAFEEADVDADKALSVVRRVGDGYHTFNELYEHRYALFAALCGTTTLAWKSHFHDDGTMFDDMFIAGIDLPVGTITYHLPDRLWNHFRVRELDRAPEWDGHTQYDVIGRLYAWTKGDLWISVNNS